MSLEGVGGFQSSLPNDLISDKLLAFQRKLLDEIINEPLGLWVVAPGLGLNKIFCKLILHLQIQCKQNKKLVIILKAEGDNLVYNGVSNIGKHSTKLINSEFTQEIREKIWKSSGVYCVTSRVFIIDVLRKKVSLSRIDSILLMMPPGYMISDCSTEAFILRLYARYCYATSENSTGPSIRAFCENPLHFDIYSKTSQVLQALRMHPKHLKLWPRIRSAVKQDLDDKLETVGLEIPLSKQQAKIHALVLDFMKGCFKELKESLRDLSEFEEDEFQMDHFFLHSFFNRFKSMTTYHKMGRRSKTLAGELDVLRVLLSKLIKDDAITYYEFLLGAQGTLFHDEGIWLDLDHGDQIRVAARSRLYLKNENCSKQKIAPKPSISLVLEENSKWNALLNVLEEIHKSSLMETGIDENSRVLVFVESKNTMFDLIQYLRNLDKYLLKKFLNFYKIKLDNNDNLDFETVLEQENVLDLDADYKSENGNYEETVDSNLIEFTTSQKLSIPVEIHLLKSVEQVLDSCCTVHFIVLYEPELSAIRAVECYKACRPHQLVRLYYLLYEDSAEKKKYLFLVDKETKAFKNIIHQRATSSAYTDTEQWLSNPIYNQNANYPEGSEMAAINTKNINHAEKTISLLESALGVKHSLIFKEEKVVNTIVVDVREFRSKLPAILDSKNVKIIPVTLSVGDYILTPDIGVERKAVSDLNQSLASGRLFNQLEQLVRTYKRPILLIEYDKSEAFKSLDGLFNFKMKLAKLTIHFNTVQIFWSRSPYDTADLFLEVKKGQLNPSDSEYNKYQEEEWIGENLEKYEALDMLKRMPGINENNWKKLVYPTQPKPDSVGLDLPSASKSNSTDESQLKSDSKSPSKLTNLNQLPTYSREELESILSQKNGSELYEFLNNTYKVNSSSNSISKFF